MNKDHWKNIFGWFNFESTYDEAVEHLKDGDMAIELGTFLGKSTCYLAQKIKESGKKVKLYACDIFIAPHIPSIPQEYWGNFYNTFLDNLKHQGVEDTVIPLVGRSLTWVNEFENKSFSFIYIDDDHSVPHVYKELNAWYPKLKDNGILAGHDFPAVQEAVIKFCKENNLGYNLIADTWKLTK